MQVKEKNLGLAFDGRISMALVFTVLLQGAAAVWWASMVEAQNHFRDTQLQELQRGRLHDNDKQELILQRLTRLEAQNDAVMEILHRLDAQFARHK